MAVEEGPSKANHDNLHDGVVANEEEEGCEHGRPSSFTDFIEPPEDGDVEGDGMENATNLEYMGSGLVGYVFRYRKRKCAIVDSSLTEWKQDMRNSDGDSASWKCFGCYGPPCYKEKKQFWSNLEQPIPGNQVVEGTWNGSEAMGAEFRRLCTKLLATSRALKVWNKEHFGQGHSSILSLEDELRNLQFNEDMIGEYSNSRQQAIIEELCVLKARQKKRNRIEVVKLEDKWVTERKGIEDYFLTEFTKLFTSEVPQLLGNLQALIQPCISELDNEELLTVPSG
ncbi:hypothetical protein FNV43_RR21842 [Rhamnella rubrinervis]|uniref:Uncharacterized protein n=1 Tax=Rhamnella rubrinervis TaxID=2594499 RepID=A0A8K0GMK9_9ROSA|nr:hypothetical protein FNV43_RR21842 [Rhamnella rubrinervis]